MITGAFLSTQNGPNGPATTVLPAMSETFTAKVCAMLVSVPAGTEVLDANGVGVARPDPFALSLAVQGTLTSVACHAAAGGVQLNVGLVLSTLMVSIGRAVLAWLLPSVVTIVSIVPALSWPWNVTVVGPSLPGRLIEPVEPFNVPLAGDGRFVPDTE